MRRTGTVLCLLGLLAPCATGQEGTGGGAQDPRNRPGPTVLQRIERLEEENRGLHQRIEALGQEVETLSLGELIPALGESRYGLGPAASKVYSLEQGVSIGGYGEFLYQQRSGQTDRFDALRGVLYFGYRYDEHFVFNSEIEFEHGTTSASSGTTSSGGSASLEFATIDYLHDEAFNLRGGLLLVPVGLINELHEPITFLAAERPQTEQRIIPTTWRELGAGAFGQIGDFAYRAYLVAGLDGEEFTAAGLRDGRQKGNRSAADDFAGVVRVDWTGGADGLLLGGAAYYGDSGQDGRDGSGNAIPDLDTLILEAHADYRTGPLWLRALYATALIDDAGAFNTATGRNLASRLQGFYVEVGCDLFAVSGRARVASLTPFVRYEQTDTQASLPLGFAADPTRDEEIITFGVNYRPISQIVLKADYSAFDQGADRFNVLLGYVF